MAIHGLNAEERFEAVSLDILDEYGVHLVHGTDFDEYRDLVAQARPDHRVGDPFDHRTHGLHKGNASWIVGRDENGQIMHTQALRVLPTQNKSLAEYFRRNFHDFSPSELDVDFDLSRYKPGPGARRIAGNVVYSGETWVGGDPGKYRGTGLSNILGRYAMLTALRDLSADYVVGFMARPVAYKGFCLRMGFMHAEPLALRWFIRGNPNPLEGVMVYMSDEDIRFVMDLPAVEIAAMAA